MPENQQSKYDGYANQEALTIANLIEKARAKSFHVKL